ncbi:MAG TPA: hypothetical protein VMY06_04265 [Sedimentisphaerales bacterium]|nr:hypothetical protein [Sedimentisphaerales bacterium]
MSGYIAGRKTMYDYVHTLSEHVHNISKVYPTLVVGKDVLAGAAGPPWVLGNFVEIVPINTIASPFDIHWLVIEAITSDAIYELVLYAATTEISRVRFAGQAGLAGTVSFSPIPMLMDIQLPNTQIQAKLACSAGAETATISVLYHTY